jgi:hypothetical protein
MNADPDAIEEGDLKRMAEVCLASSKNQKKETQWRQRTTRGKVNQIEEQGEHREDQGGHPKLMTSQQSGCFRNCGQVEDSFGSPRLDVTRSQS